LLTGVVTEMAGNLALELVHLSGYLCIPSFWFYCFPKVQREGIMAWTTPVLDEICIGLEINGYMPADGYVPPEF